MRKKQIEVPLYLKRTNFFPGRNLTVADFQAEQNYFRERMRQHNLNFHGVGIVSGLEVSLSQGPAKSIMVAPGTALDPLGNEINVFSAVRCPFPEKCEMALLVLYWAERETDPVPLLTNESETGQTMASRMEEYAILKYEIDDGRPRHRTGVILARLKKFKRRWKVDDEFQLQRAGVWSPTMMPLDQCHCEQALPAPGRATQHGWYDLVVARNLSGLPDKNVSPWRRGQQYNSASETIMSKPSSKMHVCKNCGFMSTQGNLFLVLDGFLHCIFCVEQYSELLFYLKPTKSV
jgi:hypothetical protein